jgi:hypothetical protein
MKTPSLVIGLIVAIFGLVLTFVPRLFAEEAKRCKIMVQFKRVVIPVTRLNPDDAKALDGILKKYDKSLYKIVKFDKGVNVAGSEQGSLADKYVREKGEIIRDARKARQSGEAIQVGGLGCTPACPTNVRNDDLVAEVEKLLKKYCP